MVNHEQTGKQNRARGLDTERRTRKDLESRGWIVSKWNNNVNLDEGELIVVKNKFRGIGIPMMLGAGFPDFITFKSRGRYYEVVGVECKSNGWLNQTEKDKCAWLLKNKVFSKILIASRDKINNRVEIKYKVFGVKNG